MKLMTVMAAVIVSLAAAAAAAAPAGPEILTDDVARFYAVYDAAGGKPTAEQLDRDYLAKGSPGLLHLARIRNVTGARIADTIAKSPQTYETARRCMALLPTVKQRLTAAFGKLAQMYPEATFPPVTLLIGRGRPIGLTDKEGAIVGLEALCAADFMDPNLEDRFVRVTIHEYAHLQQSPRQLELEEGKPGVTLLDMALMEGAAEFATELLTGQPGNYQHRAWTQGCEATIETAFARDIDDVELTAWINTGPGTAERPGDLAYWVGHRIVKRYYERAGDKRQALRDILEMRDPKAFLAASGWAPAKDGACARLEPMFAQR
ncbi:DUF2268 domain-containing putative Zn-dependent protease [Caulobacter mirabilis]|uniref:Lytic murein transglycosylase n=1 Tax=Caulobacter mirabilis TaxID=69666 RepID=A0A2D2AW69_9CAUL|nr:DUF2268 domain-containing putative Zn-dependent protease [Caulobacter mirabilis]ATQ42215.1 lytic murein transglycosylase [Caulobacter mirabilis]